MVQRLSILTTLQSCEKYMKIILKNAGAYPLHITQQQQIQIFNIAVTHKRIYPLKVNKNAETLFTLLKERENPG
jgi:hypothetical protein